MANISVPSVIINELKTKKYSITKLFTSDVPQIANSSNIICTTNECMNQTTNISSYVIVQTSIHYSKNETFSSNLLPNSIVIIIVLSVLSVIGVCFMIFGPLQRSEAYKRVENFTFGENPIFNIDNREQSMLTSLEYNGD